LGLFAFPLLVLYTRHASALPITWSSTAWLMVPAAGYLVLLCGRAAMGVDHRVPFAWLLPIVLGFTTAGAVTLWRRHGVSATSTVVPAMWVVAFVVMVNVAQIVRMTFGHISAVRAVVPLMLSAGFLAATALLVWRALSPRSIAVTAVSSPKYERSGLESSAARELLGRIDRALTQDRLFVRAELTLAELAVAVESTPHQVSEVLNRHAGLSFHDLVNRRRVDEVKAQLIDRTNDRFTIEGIGGAAGFGSRSALYAAFRRFEGTTPTAFRESRRGIPPSNISN
jgi:AraC-like DNA-binding protein